MHAKWYTTRHVITEGGQMISDGKVRMQITLSEDTKRRLDEACESLGVSKSAAISYALSEWLARVSREAVNAGR